MAKNLETVLEQSIKVLSDKAEVSKDSNDALKYSQAALNLVHVLNFVEENKNKS